MSDTVNGSTAKALADAAYEISELRAKVSGLEGRMEGERDAGWNDAIAFCANELRAVVSGLESDAFGFDFPGEAERHEGKIAGYDGAADCIENYVRELRK